MIAWPNGGSEAFVTDPGTPVHMPTPLASVMGIAGLGVLGSRRHRTN